MGAQAIACAEAGCTLISPFVGRIMDFYKAEEKLKDADFKGFSPPSTDPGVVSATEAVDMDIPKIDVDEKTFRWMNAQNAMATQKLAEGIRGFTGAIIELETIIQAKMD